MKHKLLTLLGIAFFAVALTGCSDDPAYILDKDKATGSVSLADLSCDVKTDEIVISRADEVNTDNFLVKIVNSDGAVVYSSTYANRNEVVTLPVGSGYRVEIHSHEVADCEWSAPYYYGSKTFEVRENEITPVGTITCTFSNVRVSIRYTDELKSLMGSDCSVEVKCSEWSTPGAVFTPDETRSAYFRALDDSNTLGATFTGTVNGQFVTLYEALSNVKAGQHHIVTFSVKKGNTDVPDEFGSVSISDGLVLSVEVTTENLGGNVNVDEDADQSAQRPGQEDPVEPEPGPGPDEPTPSSQLTITSETLSFTSPMNPSAVSSAVVNIHSDEGVAHLQVQIASTNANFELSVKELLPISFDLADIDPNSSEYESFTSLGFPMNEQVAGQNDVVFDITQFVPLLSAFSGTHTFTLTVTDAANNVKTATLTFTV